MYKQAIKNLLDWENRTQVEKMRLRLWSGKLLSYAAIIPLPLQFLLSAYGSDKQAEGNHLYGPTYDDLLGRLKYRPIKLLEIGIGGYDSQSGGQSLRAFEAYFPFGKIIGCDIAPKQQFSTRRTKIYTLDQSSEEDLTRLCRAEKAFDVIIDDGSHLSRHQILTFERLFPFLREDGLYVIEDVQTSYWKNDPWDGADIEDAGFEGTCVGYFLRLTKYLNHSEVPDLSRADKSVVAIAGAVKQIIFEHNLIVVKKGANLEASNIIQRAPSPQLA
jgi:demethylmacrocin O-methyltransferase